MQFTHRRSNNNSNLQSDEYYISIPCDQYWDIETMLQSSILPQGNIFIPAKLVPDIGLVKMLTIFSSVDNWRIATTPSCTMSPMKSCNSLHLKFWSQLPLYERILGPCLCMFPLHPAKCHETKMASSSSMTPFKVWLPLSTFKSVVLVVIHFLFLT